LSTGKFEAEIDHYLKEMAAGCPAERPVPVILGPVPEIGNAEKVPDNLIGFVDFLHPRGRH
jgi:hypothetical protein